MLIVLACSGGNKKVGHRCSRARCPALSGRRHPRESIAFEALVESNRLLDLARGAHDPNFARSSIRSRTRFAPIPASLRCFSTSAFSKPGGVGSR